MSRIGFVGAGRIGLPMVARLVAAGHRVAVAHRSPAARAAIVAAGAEPVDAVADGAEIVCVCVHTDEQVREVVLDGGVADALEPGSVLVVHTTGSPATIAAITERARGRGIEVVDAPISGGPHDVAAGAVTLYVGATDEGLTRARPALAAYGDPVLHVGPPGSGQLVKLVNNAVFAANLGVLADAVRLAGQLGLDEPAVLTGLGHGSGASRAQAAAGSSVAGFARGIAEFVGKDVAVVREVAADLGADLGVLAGLIDIA